jgi:hypothetical protein
MSDGVYKLTFLHYWGIGSTSDLSRALKSALDTQGEDPVTDATP